MTSVMTEALWKARRAFLKAGGGFNNRPPEFWLNMLESQIEEAREHLTAGLPEKALAEIADCILVSFQALHENGKHPEIFVAERIEERVLPRIQFLHDTYGSGDGHKQT